MEIEKVKELLNLKLNKDRFKHSVNVMETALDISKKHKINTDKVALAGILHDVGKEYSIEESFRILQENDIEVDNIERDNTALLHGKVGGYVAEHEFDVVDKDILNAIKFHTTGRSGMSLLEKIIYISDYIEPDRCFKKVEEIRKMAYINIDKALLLIFEDIIDYIIVSKRKLHHNTIEARDDILKTVNKKKDGK